MFSELLLILNILAPLAAGLLCLIANSSWVRRIAVLSMAITLIFSAILLLLTGSFIYSPNISVEIIVTVLDLAIISYFAYVGLRLKKPLIMLLATLQLVAVGYFGYSGVARAEPVIIVDNLSIFMNLIVNIVGSIVCIYALGYMDEYEANSQGGKGKQTRFFFFLVILLGAMNGLIFSNNMYWMAFFWEVTTLCCYELIRHNRTAEAEKNAGTALWANLIGGTALVGAIALGYFVSGSASLSSLAATGIQPAILLVFALMAMAAFTKSAQFPFHNWLLGAMVAPTPVSALLHSSTMVNAGVYLVLRMAPSIQNTSLTWAIALVGGFTFMLTAIMAINQRVSKRILAYSTIGNLGLIMLCAGLNTPLSYSAAMILILFHSVSKGMLFMGAGVVENRLRSKNVEDWEGLLGKLPLTAIIMSVGMLSMFLPPFGMLLGKWVAFEVVTFAPIAVMLMLLIFMVIGSAATTLFWVKWLGYMVIMPIKDLKLKAERLPWAYLWPLASLLGLDILAGIMTVTLMNGLVVPTAEGGYAVQLTPSLTGISTGLGDFPVWQLWISFGIIIAAGILISRSKGGAVAPPFLGGENVEEKPLRFRTFGDSESEFKVAGSFFDSAISENRLNNYAKVGGLVLLLIVFIAVIA
jgi:ech hydrogenase subunit A